MIELHALGGTDLRDASGSPLDDLLKQPKRVALLTYLVLAEPQGFQRRDTILALFWPDLDTKHARAALRKSLFVLRASLGADVVVTRGDEEVGVDTQQIRCDAHGFATAISRGKLLEGLELYRGDLLAGFFVSDVSPEWEQWLDARRVGLRARAAESAWKYATELSNAGNVAEAVRWARWASARVPDDEHAVQRLLRLLGELGDRAGAMQLYEQFRTRLQAEYGGEPSPETQKLIAAIRARVAGPEVAPLAEVASSPALQPSAARAAPTAAPPATPVESVAVPESNVPARSWWRYAAVATLIGTIGAAVGLARPRAATLDPNRLVIAPFQVFDTSLTAWAVGVEEFVSRGLDQTGGLRMVPPSVAARAATAGIDAGSAPTFGRATGAGLVLLGSMLKRGADSVRLDASLIDAETGRRLGDVQIAGTLARIDLLMDGLSAEIVHTLEAAGRAIPLPHSRLSARSLPALKMFIAGEMALRRGAWDTAQTAFRESVRLDSAFSLGWLRLGMTTLSIDVAGGPARQPTGWIYILRAAALGGLSRHDSILVSVASGLAAFNRGLVPRDSAEQRASRLRFMALEMTREYPDDAEAWFVLGEVQAAFLPLSPSTWDQAGQSLIKATELDSMFVPAYAEGMKFVFDNGDTLAGVRLVRRFLSLDLPGPARALPLLLDRLFTASVTEIERERLLDSLPPEALYRAWDRLWLLADSSERAIVVARAAARRPPDPRFAYTAPTVTRRNLAASLAYRGHVREALALAGTENSTWFPELVPDLAMVGAIPATLADSAIHAWLGAGSSSGHGLQYSAYWFAQHHDTAALATLLKAEQGPSAALMAAMALARGDTTNALRLLESSRLGENRDQYPGIMLGHLLAAKGRLRDGLSAMKRPLNNDWPTMARVVWRLERAQLAERLGDNSLAREDYAFVLAVWRTADPELSGYVNAAREGAKRLSGR